MMNNGPCWLQSHVLRAITSCLGPHESLGTGAVSCSVSGRHSWLQCWENHSPESLAEEDVIESCSRFGFACAISH